MDQPRHGSRGARPHRGPGHPGDRVRGTVRAAGVLRLRYRAVAPGEAGWTFLEVLIVIAIILILASGVGFTAFRSVARARVVSARSQIEVISLALAAYAQDCLHYPTEEQGLEALWSRPVRAPIPEGWDGPYVTRRVGTDPWGHAWDYRVPGPNGLPFALRSFGQDGEEGGEGADGDIASWED